MGRKGIHNEGARVLIERLEGRIKIDLDTNVGDLKSKTKQLDTIRRKLSKADQILEDCQFILQGLEQTKLKIEEQKNEIQDG